MSQSADFMELKEDEIRAHYVPAAEMLMQLDHTPGWLQARLSLQSPEKSPDVAATRRRFRSTTPGLLTRSTAPSSGVRLLDRIAESDDDDPLTSPAQAALAHALRRALSISLALGEAYAEQTPLKELKRLNLEGRLPAARQVEFTDLLAAEALVALYAFGNAASFLLASHSTEATVEIGSVDEVLTDNAPLALHGAIWELDQKLGQFAKDEATLIATMMGYAEQLMKRVQLRASTAPQLETFNTRSYRVEADDLTLNGFTPARAAKGSKLTMTFKKPNEVVGNHIAKISVDEAC